MGRNAFGTGRRAARDTGDSHRVRPPVKGCMEGPAGISGDRRAGRWSVREWCTASTGAGRRWEGSAKGGGGKRWGIIPMAGFGAGKGPGTAQAAMPGGEPEAEGKETGWER